MAMSSRFSKHIFQRSKKALPRLGLAVLTLVLALALAPASVTPVAFAATANSTQATATQPTATQPTSQQADQQSAQTQLATGLYIDQAYADMPEVTAYLKLDNNAPIAAADVSATLSGQALTTTSATTLAQSDEGSLYIVLIDVSTSIGAPRLEAAKSALNEFVGNMGEHDRLMLISFANAPEVLLNGTEAPDQITSAIDGLQLINGDTSLNDALIKAVAISNVDNPDLPKHKVAIIMTDGVNEMNNASYTADDVKASFSNASLPVYSLIITQGIYGVSQSAVDMLSSLSGTSGGQANTVATNDIKATLLGYQSQVAQTNVVVFAADNNQASGKTEDLMVRVKTANGTLTSTYSLPVLSYQADQSSPTAAVRQLDANTIRVTFDKPVYGADVLDNYAVFDGSGNNVPLAAVAFSDADGNITADLAFSEAPYTGDYSIQFANITDQSQEKNLVQAAGATFHIDGRSQFQRVLGIILHDFWWALLIVGLAVIGLVAFLIIRRHRGIVKVEGKIGFGDAVEYQQHFLTPESSQLCLIVTDMQGKATKVVLNINKSIFVGRSNENNLSFDDVKLSRQHFAIELEDGKYFFSDLDSTNGSFINGVPVQKRRLLEENDVITAGNEKFIFKGTVV